MNLHGIYHKQKSNYCYAYNNNIVHIRLRTAKDDCSRVMVVVAEKHRWMEKKKYPMKKISSDHLYDYYQYELRDMVSRIGYYFEVSDEKEVYCYSESGFTKDFDDNNAYFHYFQFPYLNEIDLLKVPAWVKNTVFYQIFVERFYSGEEKKELNNLTPWNEPPGPHSFYGGDLRGIIKKLDYLVELGINGIYLTPIFKSPSNHKYDTIDYLELDPMFGDKDTLCELVELAHSKGIRIILDGVFNHSSWYFAPFLDVVEKGEASRYKDWFYISSYPITRYEEKEVNDYSRPLDLSKLNYSIFGTSPNMPKLNTDNMELRNYILDIVSYWMKETNIDGWRLDVSDEVSHDFWRAFRKTVKDINKDALIIGENWHNSYPWLLGDQFDGVMNYPFTKTMIQFFGIGEKNSYEVANDLSEYLTWNYWQANEAMLNLLDSHDTMRFLRWCKEDDRKLKMAYMILFSYIGMPCIYYGSEIGITGGGDPDCRRTFDWNKENWNQDLYTFCKSLITIRKESKALTIGEISIYERDSLLYIVRLYEGEKIVTIINNTDRKLELSFLSTGKVLLKTYQENLEYLPAYSGVMMKE